MASVALFPLEAFYPSPAIAHVCAAGESLPLIAQETALKDYLQDKSTGTAGREAQERRINDVRQMIAQEWCVPIADIGFGPSVADCIGLVVGSLDWPHGSNVYIHEDEYPSLVAPIKLLEKSGQCEVRYGGTKELESMVDHDTRMIAVSAVSYLNAERADLTAYRQAADRAGATLVVDFTQAAGYSPIDASIADFAFSACYKWLLGTTGTCIAFWNRTRQPEWQPRAAGWHSLATGTAKPNWKTDAISIRDDALCFSCGNPAHLSIYMLQEGLKFLGQWETSEIKEHVQTLTAELLRRLDRLGMPSTTPRAMASHGASVTVECNGASEIVYAMSQAGVYAWNGRGRVRFSFHGYNCMADVDRIMDTFPALWKTFNGI